MKWLYALALIPGLCCGIELQPWYGEVYEFHWVASYAYSRFSTVQGARPQLQAPFNANLIYTAP